jgi:hypothetical protein
VQAGAVIGQAWDLYKAQWRHLIAIAFVVYVLISLLEILLGALLGWFGIFLASLVGLAGIFWLQGALVIAIEDVRDGRADLSIGETLERLRPRLNTLTVAGLLAAIGIGIGIVLLIVPGLFLLTIWLLIVPAIVLEGCSVSESFSRSRELVRGYGWAVFGVIVLTVLILIGIDIVFGIIGAGVDSTWGSFALNVVSQSVSAPFVALAWTLTYYELRGLKGTAATAEPAV